MATSCSRVLARSMGWMMALEMHAAAPPQTNGLQVAAILAKVFCLRGGAGETPALSRATSGLHSPERLAGSRKRGRLRLSAGRRKGKGRTC
jgi:hypothetical protein